MQCERTDPHDDWNRLRRWVDSVLAHSTSPEGTPHVVTGAKTQRDGGRGFALVRLETSGAAVWFKSAGSPNEAEYCIAARIAERHPRHSPRLLACHDTWRGWLAEEVSGPSLRHVNTSVGTNIEANAGADAWTQAAADIASIQIDECDRARDWLQAGCTDLRVETLVSKIDAFFDGMTPIFERQVKPSPPPLLRDDLAIAADALHRAFEIAARVPDTLVHADLRRHARGTNVFGGTVFEYFRDDSLDATDFFVNRGGLPKPPLSQHQFGGALGGPVWLGRLYDGRGRTHFFASHETLRLEQPQAISGTTISMVSRTQAPAAIRPLFDAYPLPTGADLGGGLARFEASYSTPSRARASSLRLDHAIGSRVTAFGRYNHAPSSTDERDTATPSVVRHEDRDTDTLTIGSTMILAAASLLDVRYNYSAVAASTVRTLDTFGGAVPPSASALLPEVAGGQGYVNVNLGGAAPGFAAGTDALNRQRQHQLVAALTFAFGAHTLKAGTDWRRFRSTFGTDQDSQYRPTYNFSGVAGALAGTLGSGLINVRESARLDFDNLSLYVQDDWRPSPRLTLSYGLRYELNPAPRGVTNEEHPSAVTTTEPLASVSLAPPGTPLYATSTRTAGPRAGAVYRLGDRRGWTTTIRGGYGLFFDLGYGAVANAAGAFPLLRTKRLAAGTSFPLNAANAAPLAADAGPPYDLIRALDPNLQLPRTH